LAGQETPFARHELCLSACDAYNAERDNYLRSTLAEDVKGNDPANDAIAAYLAEREAGGPA
jgi:hypothetical protein